jgi:hypothetical protein
MDSKSDKPIDTVSIVETDATNEYKIIDNRDLRKKIITELLYPIYYKEVKSSLEWRIKWTELSSFFFIFTTIIVSMSSILSFSAPQFPNIPILSYIAGCVNIIALMSDRFAHYCVSQSSTNTKKTNILINSIGINDTIPDVASSSVPDFVTKIKPPNIESQQTYIDLLPNNNNNNTDINIIDNKLDNNSENTNIDISNNIN